MFTGIVETTGKIRKIQNLKDKIYFIIGVEKPEVVAQKLII